MPLLCLCNIIHLFSLYIRFFFVIYFFRLYFFSILSPCNIFINLVFLVFYLFALARMHKHIRTHVHTHAILRARTHSRTHKFVLCVQVIADTYTIAFVALRTTVPAVLTEPNLTNSYGL